MAVHMGEVGRDRVRHLPDHGEHCALGRITHRLIRRVGRPRECGRDEHRVHELARSARELLGGAANDLAQDHAGVSPGAHQRRADYGVTELVAVGGDRLPVQAVELLHHRLHGQRHVVARVAIGDREDVQVVHLLAAGGEFRVGGLYDPAKALDGGVDRHREGIIPPGTLCGLDDLAGLQAPRADVDAAGAPAVVDSDLLEVRIEAAPGRDHRVAPRVSERGTLAAAVADLGHEAVEVSR